MSSIILNQIMVLFLIIIIGYICSKAGIINKETRGQLAKLILFVTLPALVLVSFQMEFSASMLNRAVYVFIFAILVHSISAVAGHFFYRTMKEDRQKVMKFVMVFSNCAFMGFPVLEALYGSKGIFLGSIYGVIFNFFLWTYGLMVFTGKRDFHTIKKALMNPGTISVVVGFILFLLSVKLPGPLFDMTEMVGHITMPLSMIIIGSVLADTKIRHTFSGIHIYLASFIRLIAIPVICMIVLKLLGFDSQLLGICVILVAMPAAVNTAIFSELHGGDEVLSSRIIVLSTLLSAVTIPLLISFV